METLVKKAPTEASRKWRREHDYEKAVQQTENGSLEAGKTEMEAGGLSAQKPRTPTAEETGQGKGLIKLPWNILKLLKALERRTGKKPVYVGQDRGYEKHLRYNWIGHCPLHKDRRPSLSVGFDLVSGWAFAKCPVCGESGDRESRNKWIARFCEKLGLGRNALRPVKGWQPIAPTEEEPEPGLPPEDLEARFNLLNEIYGHVSRNTGVLPEHEQNLLDRGLTKSPISKNGYFSIELVPHVSYGPRPKQIGLPGACTFRNCLIVLHQRPLLV